MDDERPLTMVEAQERVGEACREFLAVLVEHLATVFADTSVKAADLASSLREAADQASPPKAADEWRCRACGSPKWVSASLNGGLTKVRQCVPCGHYSSDLTPYQ